MERKLTAILCADVYGYSRLMGEDEEATLHTLSAYRKIIDSLIENHRGRFVNSAGDSVLAEFTSVVEAVNCAVEIQGALRIENAHLPPERRMEFRIGVNSGDVMVEGQQIYGDGVNVAARLESLADPGGICVSGVVYDEVKGKSALSYQDLGPQPVKNIVEPVHVWRVMLDGTPVPRDRQRLPRGYWPGGVLSVTGLAIIVGMIFLVQRLSLKPPRTSASIPPQEKPALPLPGIPSIAVLPFMNLSDDPRQEYFSDGISNQLIEDLSRVPGLFVIARNSSFAYKGKAINEHAIGKELGVKYLLEGSVRKAAARLRIGVQLVEASSGTETWTQRFDRPLGDMFAMQDEIVSKVVRTLGLLVKLEAMKHPNSGYVRLTDNLDAFDDLLNAQCYLWLGTKDGNAMGRQWAEKAIQLDPKFAQAYAFLAWTHLNDGWNQWSSSPAVEFTHARELAQRVLALDDSNVYALAAVTELDWMQRRFEQAVADGERAVAMNPNYAEGYLALADALSNDRKPEEALRAAQKAIRLDPASADYYAYQVGISYIQMGRYQEAIPVLQRFLTAYPNSAFRGMLAVAYMEAGREQEARAEAAEIMRFFPNYVLPPPETSWTRDVALNKRWQTDLRRAGLK